MGNKVDIAESGVVGGAQILATLDPRSQLLAVSLTSALGLSFAAWSYLSDKRNRELFDNKKFVNKLIKKCESSDDFASLVFDVWQKHNLESSEERRKMLKRFLEKEADTDDNEFENFSKIEHIIQNANLRAIRLLNIIHSDLVQKRSVDPNNGSDRLMNLQKLTPLVQSVENMHEQDIEYFLNELGNYGLLSPLHGRMNGTFYLETKLGFTLMSYINQ